MTRMTQLDASDATVQSPIQSFFIRGPFIGRPIKHADVFWNDALKDLILVNRKITVRERP